MLDLKRLYANSPTTSSSSPSSTRISKARLYSRLGDGLSRSGKRAFRLESRVCSLQPGAECRLAEADNLVAVRQRETSNDGWFASDGHTGLPGPRIYAAHALWATFRTSTRSRCAIAQAEHIVNVHKGEVESTCAPYWSLRARLAVFPWKLRSHT